MAFFDDDFHGFIGSKEYDEYLGTLDFSDEDTSYVGLLKEEAEEKKAELGDFVKDVADCEMVAFPAYKLVVFDNPGISTDDGRIMADGKFPALQMFPDGTWRRSDLAQDELVTLLCNDGREASYDPENGHLGEFLDKLKDLGVPVREDDRERIASFATFADKLSPYAEGMKASKLDATFAEREAARKDYEDSLKFSSGRVSRAKPQRVKPQPQRSFSPAAKARYYARMAEKETVDFVKDRYAEKAEYWGKVSRGEEVSPELEASCGPDHKWNAADNYINARHKLEKGFKAARTAVELRVVSVLQKRVDYWEQAAREEKKVNDMVKSLDFAVPLCDNNEYEM